MISYNDQSIRGVWWLTKGINTRKCKKRGQPPVKIY